MIPRQHWGTLVSSFTFIFVIIGYLMIAVDYVSDPPIVGIIGIGSISASLFTILVRPDREAASYRNILVGYGLATLVGLFFHYVDVHAGLKIYGQENPMLFVFMGAFSVTAVIIVFIRTDTDHPPAVGMTLAIHIGHWNMPSLLIFLSAILCMIGFRYNLIRQGKNHAYWWRNLP